MMKEYITTAVLYAGKKESYYRHFGVTPTLSSMYGVKPADIVNVKCTITDISIDTRTKGDKELDYWGWISKENPNYVSMIWACFMQFDMCFTAGAEAAEKSGRGECVNMTVEQI